MNYVWNYSTAKPKMVCVFPIYSNIIHSLNHIYIVLISEDVRLHLAKAGLCELLIELLEKHVKLADDDETRNLLKMACYLIVIILNGGIIV